MKRERIDRLLVEKGIVQSRERARALIMGGKVTVDEQKVDKAGTKVNSDARVEIREEDHPFVSRGGVKLESALNHFEIEPQGMVVMDVGASTGGFTDCVLKRGARKVYAVDVGYGQLAWRLQNDPRVVSLERSNIRYLKKEQVHEEVDLILVDTSFISIRKFLPGLLIFLKREGAILSLIKPQFEVGKGEVGKGGVVRDPRLHRQVIDGVSALSREIGLTVLGVTESPILGPKGNKEFFIYLRREG